MTNVAPTEAEAKVNSEAKQMPRVIEGAGWDATIVEGVEWPGTTF